MIVKRLLGTLFDIRKVYVSDEDEITLFENTIFYKECFSRACNVQLFDSCFEKNSQSLISLWDGRVIGIIQAVDAKNTMFNIHEHNSIIIVNFCINKKYRSYNVGTNMLRGMLSLCQNYNIYIAVDKKEQYNDSHLLYAFYTKHGFIFQSEGSRYILLRSN